MYHVETHFNMFYRDPKRGGNASGYVTLLVKRLTVLKSIYILSTLDGH